MATAVKLIVLIFQTPFKFAGLIYQFAYNSFSIGREWHDELVNYVDDMKR